MKIRLISMTSGQAELLTRVKTFMIPYFGFQNIPFFMHDYEAFGKHSSDAQIKSTKF